MLCEKKSSLAVGDLEDRIHEEFAVAFTSNYVKDEAAHARLDSYCNKLWVKEAASPLVILGAPGSGKSALLANWKLNLNSRPVYFHVQHDQEKEPFLFYHNVGCTRASTCVDQMLRRLIGTLKSNFKLSTHVPIDPKRLPWCLSMFLELSAAIRPIFVVIDGIHRLQSSEGDYDNLQWLPLSFPANVRFIISVTTTEIYQDNDKQKNSPGDEVIMELRNRKWPVMQLKPLDEARRWAILNCFLFKRKPCASVDTGDEGGRKNNSPSDFIRREMPVANDMAANKKFNYVTPSEVVWLDSEGRRLHLFPSMMDSIVHAEATSSVRYLRLLLHALEAGHIQGYNLQTMLHYLLQAKDVNSLYLAVLEHFEKGHLPPTTEHTAAAASETSFGKHTESPLLDLSKAKDKKETSTTSLKNECRSLVVNKEQSSSLNEMHQFQETKKECTTIETNQDDHDDSCYPDESGAFEAADEGKKERTESFRKAQTMSELTHRNNRAPISKAAATVVNDHRPTYSSKEKIGISEVPLSLRGGSRQASDPLLMTMLKKALALIHSSRHGLQESELWDMLCTLAEREAEAAEKDVETDIINHLAFRLMQSRGRLMDLIRDMDTNKNGTVDIHEFKNGLETLGVHLTDQQIQNIVKCIDTDGNGELDFDEIIERYGNAVRRPFVGGRRSVTPSFLAQQNENEMGSVANVDHEDGSRLHNRLTLSEGLKKILICIMRGLGVSYHPNNSLFLLGFDSEDFRSIIHKCYIGDGSLWHRRFVRYFSPLSPSVRRCEELPWHLRKCYRWGGLKSTLTDLRTFDIMWKHPQLKRELISYWLELTQGLLWKNESHENMMKLSETVQPSLLKRLTVKRGSRYIFNDGHTAAVSASRSLNDNTKVSCFDIFDGYNKAVELWQAAEKPTMQHLGKTVGMIGELMVEMSAQLQDDHSTIPPFLHYPIDTKDLERLGISGILFQNGNATTKQKVGHHPIHKLKGDGKRDTADQKIKGMDKGGSVSIHQENQSKERVEDHQSLIKFQDHIETLKRLSEPKRRRSRLFPEHLQVPSHYFQRWIWVQFPWLALVNAIEPRRENTTKEGGNVVLNSKNIIPAKKVGSSKEGVNIISTTPNRLGPVRRIIDASPMNKKQGLKAAALLKNVVSDIYSDMPASNSITSDGVLKSARGGLNPTIVPQSIQNNTNDDQRFLTHKDNNHLSSSGVMRGLLKRNPSVVRNHDGFTGDCIDKNTESAAVWYSTDFSGIKAELTSIQPSAMPPPPEELVVQKAQAKAKGLRNILDGLLKERNEKSQILKTLSILIHLRDDQDAHTASEAAAGEKVLCALKTRLSAANVAVEDTRELRSFLQCIINTCIKNPPQEKLHLSALEHQVKLADQQMKDLVTHMCPVLEETNEIEERGIQGFREHLTRVRKVRAQVEERANKLRANIEHIMAEGKLNEAESHHHVPGLKVPMFARRVKRLTSVFTSKAKTQKEGMASVVLISKEVAPVEDKNAANIICTDPQPVNNNPVVKCWVPTSSTAVRREETNDDENANAEEDSLICALEELMVSTGVKVVEELPSIVRESLDTETKLVLYTERLSQQAEELRDELKSSQEELSKVKAVGVDTESINGVKTLGQDLWALEAVSIKGKNITSYVSHRTIDKDIEAANIRYQQACGRLCSTQSLLSEVTSSIEHIEKLCDTILPPQLESPPLTMVVDTPTITSGGGLEEANSVKCLKTTTERLLAAVNSTNLIICPLLQSPENGSNDALPSFWVSGFSPGRVRTEAASVNASDVCTTLDRAFSIEMETGKEGLEASSCDIHVVAEKYRDLRFQGTTDLQKACQDDGALLTTDAEEKKLDASLHGTPPLIEALRSSESMNLLRKANILMPSAVQHTSGQQHGTYGLVIDHLIQASQAE